MPAISMQIYGATVSGIQNTAPTRRENFQPRQSEQGTPPYSVELSRAALREQEAAPKQEMLAPELLKALNNDVTRTSSEMSEAISENHLHIQGMFSKDASSSFNFFGVSMPLAATSFEFPSVQSGSGSAPSSDKNDVVAHGAVSAPVSSEGDTNAPDTLPAPPPPENESENQTAPQPADTHRIVPSESEIVNSSRRDATMDYDSFSAQLNGMAMAATASPASSPQAAQR